MLNHRIQGRYMYCIFFKITFKLNSVFMQVYAEEIKGGNEVVQLTFRAASLDKKVKLFWSSLFVICYIEYM